VTAPGAAAGAGPRAGRFVAGDPIRGIAAIAVIVYHAAFLAQPLGRPQPANLGQTYGSTAGDVIRSFDLSVFIFLVLSGYLLGRPFVTSLVEGTPLPSIRRYARNRVLRIVPVFWVAFALILLWHGPGNYRAIDILSVFAFAQNYHASSVAPLVGPAWTLDIEATFYLLLPLAALVLAWLAGSRGSPSQRRLLLLGLLALAYAGSLLAKDVYQPGGTLTLLTLGFGFVPGLALAAVETARPARELSVAAGRRWFAAIALTGLAAYVLYVMTGDPGDYPPRPETSARLLVTVAATAVVAAPLVLQWAGGGCPRVLDNRVAHWLGERSFPLYVVHQAVFLEFVGWSFLHDRPWLHVAVVLAIGLPIALALAALLHVAVERPFLRRRLEWRARRRAVSPRAG
jgi:peptidoglycan/LPS O-acetylase OafA/YrhL